MVFHCDDHLGRVHHCLEGKASEPAPVMKKYPMTMK